MLRICWKEWRENWALFVSVIVAGQGLLFLLTSMGVTGGPKEDWLVCQFLVVMLSACIGGSLVGQEAEKGTLELMWTRPVPRWHVWAGKLLFGLPVSVALGASFAWTVDALGGKVPAWLPPASAWPWEAALAFLAGFTMSGVVRGSLVSAMCGIQLWAVIAGALAYSSLNVWLFWPVAILALVVTSLFTTMSALQGRIAERARSFLFGAVAGVMLFPATLAALALVPRDSSAPAGAQWLNIYEPIAARPGWLLAQVSVPTHPLDPLRGEAEYAWSKSVEKRLMVIEAATGLKRWLPPRDVGFWEVTLDGEWVVFEQRRTPGKLARQMAMRLDEPGRVVDLGAAEYWIDTSYDPVFTVLEGGTMLRRSNVAELFGDRHGATAARMGLVPCKIDRPEAWRVPPGSSKLLLDQYVWNRSSPRLLDRWFVDLETQEAGPVVPTGPEGPMHGARFLEGLRESNAPFSLFTTADGSLGVCRTDGSEARLLRRLGEHRRFPASGRTIRWTEDGKFASLEGRGADAEQCVAYVDPAAGTAVPVATPGVELGEWQSHDVVPAEGGVFIAVTESRDAYPQRARHRALYWCAASGAEPELLRSTDALTHDLYCSIHRTSHPLWIEGIGEPNSWKWRTAYGPRGTCIEPSGQLPAGLVEWDLVSLRPPASGGPSVIRLAHDVAANAPYVALRGNRAFVRRGRHWVDLLDLRAASPRPRSVPEHGFDPLEHFSRVEWLTDRYILQSARAGAWIIDADTNARRLLFGCGS